MPKISVIIPVYNVEDYIEKCLDSVVSQTLEDIEIIVVNDGSTDLSKEKINKYLEKYPEKIKYLEKENGGLSSARNFGIPTATGKYIAFLDSDDYIEKDAYEKMYNLAEKTNADMVDCDFLWEYYKNTKIIKTKIDQAKPYTSKEEMIEMARVVAWNKLIKRDIIERENLRFPEGLRYEDVEFFYKLVPYLNNVSFSKEPFIHYVQRKTSIANTQNSRTEEIFTVLDNVITYYKEKGIFEKYKLQLEYIYTRFLLCSSLKRMCKIKNKKERKHALRNTWENLNTKFPNWRKNAILKKKSLKNIYIRSINKFTYKIYCLILEVI